MNKYIKFGATVLILFGTICPANAGTLQQGDSPLKATSNDAKVSIVEAGACKKFNMQDGANSTTCASQCKQSFDLSDGKIKISC